MNALSETIHPFPGVAEVKPVGLRVFVKGLKIEAGIGIHAHEQGRLQTLIVDVALDLTPRPVLHIAETLNYEIVAQAARALVAVGHIGLVETFAQDLATTVMDDPRVVRVEVRVEKPDALSGAAAAGCEVVLERG